MEILAILLLFSLLILFYSKRIKKIKEGKDREFMAELEKKFQAEKTLKEKELEEALEEKEKELQKKYSIFSEKYTSEMALMKNELTSFRAKQEAIHQDILRKKELEEKEDFYKIQMSQNDIEDFQVLESLSTQLKRKDLIPKLIWDSLVSRPTSEMIKRVVGTKVGGIYKITYSKTGESYIGRTTNFKDRWKNHIQTAVGMEKAATSTLHTHMKKNGIWNYTFEILEECDKELQSEREKFYIELYGTKSQLNIRAGG